VVAAFAVVGCYTAHILTYLPTFSDTHSGSSVHEEWLTLEYWIGRLSLNIGKGPQTQMRNIPEERKNRTEIFVFQMWYCTEMIWRVLYAIHT